MPKRVQTKQKYILKKEILPTNITRSSVVPSAPTVTLVVYSTVKAASVVLTGTWNTGFTAVRCKIVRISYSSIDYFSHPVGDLHVTKATHEPKKVIVVLINEATL